MSGEAGGVPASGVGFVCGIPPHCAVRLGTGLPQSYT